VQDQLEVLALPSGRGGAKGLGHQLRTAHQFRRGVGPVLSCPGDLKEHGASLGVKHARHDRVVFVGAAIEPYVRKRPGGRLAVVGDAERPLIGIDEVAQLAADFLLI
jgi:hypothetical protein